MILVTIKSEITEFIRVFDRIVEMLTSLFLHDSLGYPGRPRCYLINFYWTQYSYSRFWSWFCNKWDIQPIYCNRIIGAIIFYFNFLLIASIAKSWFISQLASFLLPLRMTIMQWRLQIAVVAYVYKQLQSTSCMASLLINVL